MPIHSFLFSAVAVSGLRIISTHPFTRRNRFILTCALALGFGAELQPNGFSYVFTYTGGGAKGGFFDAIVLITETGFALCAFVSLILNLLLPEEIEVEDMQETGGLERSESVSLGPAADLEEPEKMKAPV